MRSLVLVLALLAPLGESASAAAKNTRVSRDATCGGSKGYTCLGSVWGDCCSQYGWCGSTTAYCGSGCKSAYGSCKRKPAPSSSTTTTTTRPASTTSRRSSTVIVTLPSSTATTSSSLAPVATQRVSQNARCGPKFQGKTCLGSRWGDCCSQYSYCGSTKAYCAADTCQKGFGKCNGGGSSSSRTSSSTAGSSSSSTSLVSSSGAGTASSSSAAVVSSSESSSLVAEISSSATQTSSDSAVVSSSATSTATSSTSNPQPTCFDVPDCDSLAPSINTACSLQANSGKCAAGYQARCGTRPQTGSVEISNSPSTSTGGDACAAACTLDSTCVGFVWTSSFTGVYSCVLYSTITSVTTGFGSTYLKVCDDAVSGSASSVIASSTPTLSIIATTVSASNTIDATSSASPVASVCPYLVPSCLPAQTVSSLDNVNCQAGITCTSRYTMRCNMQVATTAAIIGIRPAIDVEDCASQCDGDLTCLGFAFVKSTSTPVSYSCTFYNHFPRVLQASNTVLYTRVCPSAPMIESSSSLVASSISVASSSLDSSSITPSASESLASSTSASTSVASPSATECPYIVDGTNCPPTDSSLANLASTCPASDSYCTSRYATACGSIPIGGDAVVSSVDTSPNNADSCASTCDQDAACIGFVYSIEDSPDSTFTCKFYSRVGGLTEAGRSDTVAFLKYCVDAPAESSSSSVSPTSSDVIPSSTSSVDSSVSSSGSSTSPSASPTPGPYAGSCPARNGQCVSNYQVNCATTLVQPDDTNFAWYQVTSADQCIAYCSSESTCVGVQIVYPRVAGNAASCLLYNAINMGDSYAEDGIDTFLKGCSGGGDEEAMSSSLSSAQSTPLSTFSTVTVAASSSSSSSTPLEIMSSSSTSSSTTQQEPTSSSTSSPSSSSSSPPSAPTPNPQPECAQQISSIHPGFVYTVSCNTLCSGVVRPNPSLIVPSLQTCVAYCDTVIPTAYFTNVAAWDSNNGLCLCYRRENSTSRRTVPGYFCAVTSTTLGR